MSSMNPSTATLSRNLGTGDEDMPIGSTNNLSQLDTRTENMIPETASVLFCNLSPNNTMTQNNNTNVSTAPIADATFVTCVLNVSNYKLINDGIVIRNWTDSGEISRNIPPINQTVSIQHEIHERRAEIVEIPITQINQQGLIHLSFQPQWYILPSDEGLTLLELHLSESQPTSAQPIQQRNVRKRKLSKPMKYMKKTNLKKKIKKRVRRN